MEGTGQDGQARRFKLVANMPEGSGLNGGADPVEKQGEGNAAADGLFGRPDELYGPGGLSRVEMGALKWDQHKIGTRHGIGNGQGGCALKVANDKAVKADNERQTAAVTTVAVAEAGEGGASTTAAATATMTPPPPMAAVSTTPATALTLGAHTKLLLSSLPGPVRDTIDRFNKGEQDLASTRFLSLAAAVAYLQELKEEADSWGGVTSELASLAGGATTHVDGALLGRLF